LARKKLRTKLCDVLDIEYPILLAGMGGIAEAPLAIAVSEAGGLGTLGAAVYEPDELDAAIKEVRRGTSKPFAVDLLLPRSLKDMEGVSKEGLMKYIPDEYFAYEKELRKKFAVPEDFHTTRAGALWTSAGVKGQIQVCLDNKIPVLAAGLGRLGDVMPECKARGVKTIGIGSHVKMAMSHFDDQVDVIVAQGFDAGGHTGNIGTMAVVPQIVDAVKPIPVAAAGGIADGRGLVAALALGAVGVWCGSMFLLCPETTYSNGQQDRVIAATEREALISRAVSGKPLRQLRTPFTEAWDKGALPPLGWPFHNLLIMDIVDWAYTHWDDPKYDEILVTPVGQSTRLLDRRRPAKEVLDCMVEEAVRILEETLPRGVETGG